MSRLRGTTLVVVTVLAASLAATTRPGHADWPIARHDVARTGAATGVSNIKSPLPYWRHYLGGSLELAQGVQSQTSSSASFVFVEGGRLASIRPDGITMWRTPNLALVAIVGEADLDGDGAPEVIARSTNRVYVVDRATGDVHWAEPVGEMGTIGSVRVTDLDGDTRPDLLVQECWCCGVRSDTPGVAYSFADNLGAPTLLWELPSAACGGNRAMLAEDIDGDGRPEVLLSTHHDLRLLDGETGQLEATTIDLGDWMSLAHCEAADVVPGAGGSEIICAFGSSLAPAGTGHRVFALGWASGPNRLEVVWSTDIGDVDAEPALGGGWIHDLDLDGTLEVTLSGTNSAGLPVTVILDASTGSTLLTVDDTTHVTAMSARPGESIYITADDRYLIASTFQRTPTPALTERWRLRDRRVLMQRTPGFDRTREISNRPVLVDVDSDGDLDLFTINLKTPEQVLVYDHATAAMGPLRSWNAQPSSTVRGAWVDDDHVFVSSSDGRVTALLHDAETAAGHGLTGGYYDAGARQHLPNAPVAGQLILGGGAEIVVADSRRALMALDASTATNATPPSVLWTRHASFAPAIVAGIGTDGEPAVACQRTDVTTTPPTQSLAVVDANGLVRWQAPLGPISFNDSLPGNFDGDGIPDLVVQWGLTSDTALRTSAFAGSDGRLLWTHVANDGVARFPSGHSVTDWNSDGIDDVVFHHYRLRVLSGADGSVIAENAWTGEPSWYFMPTLVDLDGDTLPEISLHAGQPSLRTLARDLTTVLWGGNGNDLPYPYAAAARCGTTPVLVSTSGGHPARLDVTPQVGMDAGSRASVVLASGHVFADEATALAAGASPGQLTSVHVHENLSGLTRPTAVVGSSDGWLYGVDPCTRSLDFAVHFDAPVGASAFADTDGDGLDELIVSVADGYLYGLRHAPLPGPATVRDIDLSTGELVDVDEVTTRDTLSAAWDPVPGAEGYEVAIVRGDGALGFLTTPAWTPVESTSFTHVGLNLIDGERYTVAVRARAAGGVSPDVLSDGVNVRVPPVEPPTDAGTDAGDIATPPGGCCSSQRNPAGAVISALLLLAVLGTRRRRSRMRPVE